MKENIMDQAFNTIKTFFKGKTCSNNKIKNTSGGLLLDNEEM